MFTIGQGTKYKVAFIKGGEGAKGEYTFITVEDKLRKGQKFPERLKINVWGKNLEPIIAKDSYITITSVKEVGLVFSQDKNDESKTYQNLTVTCDPSCIQLDGATVLQQENSTYSVPVIDDLSDLPF